MLHEHGLEQVALKHRYTIVERRLQNCDEDKQKQPPPLADSEIIHMLLMSEQFPNSLLESQINQACIKQSNQSIYLSLTYIHTYI